MPRIEILADKADQHVTVSVPEGDRLVDICDDAMAPVPFSCRAATCGTCHVEVLEGADLLEPPGDEEQELLDILDGPPTARLACQAVVKPGPGKVRLRTLT